jgi:hypothetical protein
MRPRSSAHQGQTGSSAWRKNSSKNGKRLHQRTPALLAGMPEHRPDHEIKAAQPKGGESQSKLHVLHQPDLKTEG